MQSEITQEAIRSMSLVLEAGNFIDLTIIVSFIQVGHTSSNNINKCIRYCDGSAPLN